MTRWCTHVTTVLTGQTVRHVLLFLSRHWGVWHCHPAISGRLLLTDWFKWYWEELSVISHLTCFILWCHSSYNDFDLWMMDLYFYETFQISPVLSMDVRTFTRRVPWSWCIAEVSTERNQIVRSWVLLLLLLVMLIACWCLLDFYDLICWNIYYVTYSIFEYLLLSLLSLPLNLFLYSYPSSIASSSSTITNIQN